MSSRRARAITRVPAPRPLPRRRAGAVYDNLISTVRANLQPLFQYYRLRKRLLRLPEIHQYDTYVPIVLDIETHVPFDEAVDKVIVALRPLGAEYCQTLGEGLAPRALVRPIREQGQALRRVLLLLVWQSAVHADEL